MISLADLKLYIGAANDGTDADTILTDLEVWAVALVERATGRYFGASGAVTWYLEAGGSESIFLPDFVTAVSAVSYRGYPYEDWTDLTVTDEYVLLGNELIRTDGSYFPLGRNTVRVTATRGYAAGDEPAPIRTLVKDLVNWQYRAGRKLSLEDFGSPDVGKVAGWERTIGMYRGPMYG